MNRFLTRKKTEAALEGSDAPLPSTKKSKKGKKNKEEPKPELDLTQALPSSDNFRTSLLMPNLSARFSMLREQDDPESKLGKASDDSVLYPKRQSRLTDFGFNSAGLTDIAEVSSINGSIRPPFLSERSGSIDGGYGTDDGDSIHSGSVMSRSRPGEGNVLFGGRQKVYLGNRALYDDDVGMSAYQRLRAEERRKKMEEDAAAGRGEEQEEDPESLAHELKHSSSFSGSLRRRETASSTTSGYGARASTAATSIASQGANSIPPPSANSTVGQGLERAGTKGRRLYEQGLDRNIQEGNSAISRLNSLQKQRTVISGRATPPLTQTRSATNLSDRFNRGGQYRAASPPPSAPLANMSNFMAAKDGDSQQSSPAIATSSPTSPFPPISPLDESSPLTSHIQPGDRGKATAMGAFNKPAQQFDENQYLQRQKQMMQGRETPPLKRPSRSPSRAVQERLDKLEMKRRESDAKFKQAPPSKTVSDARKRLDALRNEIAADLDDLRPSSDSEDEAEKRVEGRTARSRSRTNSSSKAPPVPKVPASPPKPISLPKPVSPPRQPLPPKPVSPPREIPDTGSVSPPLESPVLPTPRETAIPKPKPAGKTEKPSAFSVFQRAKQQMQAQAVDSGQESPEKEQGTFFASPGSSDDEDDEPVPEPLPLRSPVSRAGTMPGSKQQSPVATRSNPVSVGSSPAIRSPPPVQDHPALRPQGPMSPVSRASENMLQALNSPNESERKSSVSTLVKSDATDLDSPTLGPDNGGLNGMIRQHLRNQSQQSGVSSVYDNEQNDDDDNNGPPHPAIASSMISETPGHSSYSHSNPWDLEDLDGGYYGEADSLSSVSPVDPSRSKTQPFPRSGTNMEPFRSEPMSNQQQDREEAAPWEQEEMKSKHTRNVSHSTIAEREAFQKDLEDRQKAIQEALRNKVETESRSGSPTPGVGGAFKAFGMLRAKSSKDTLASRQGGNSKAMNMLGVNGSSSNVSLARGSEEQLRRPKDKIIKSQMTSDEADYRKDFEDRLTRGASGDPQGSKSRSPSAHGTGRSRSNSNVSGVSGRSRSRNGPRESDEHMPPLPSQIPRSGLPTPDSMPAASPIVEPPPNPPALRARSGSRPSASGYFDSKSLHPIQTGLSNGMSRVAPASAGASPHISPGLPSGRAPMVSGTRSAGHSPGIPPMPMKAATFAAHSNHSSPAIAPPPVPSRRTGGVPPERKKSIAKSIISEPMFLSSTSVVDTIELPPGASLKNGMDEVPPPLPPINPMRRRFGFGRSDSHGSSTTNSEGRPSTDDSDSKKSRGRLRKSSNPALYRAANPENDDMVPMRPPPPVSEGAMF